LNRLSLIASALLATACGADAIPAPRGVLLISVDSLRADHVTSYGYKSSTQPQIDTMPIVHRRLASDGTLFTNASSTTSWTLPSHMAMLTGLPNELHRVREIGYQLDPEQPLLAEQFFKAGWRTAGFWSGPNLDPWFGFERGFELYADCSTSRAGDEGSVFAIKDGMSVKQVTATKTELKEIHDGSHVGITGYKTVAAFEEWFAEIEDTEKFFAFVHMWDVHYDYTPPPEFDVFDPDYRGTIDGVNIDDQSKNRNPPSARDVEHVIALYDGEIRFTDSNIGKLLDQIDQRGRLDSTLVVFTSDHGEEFLEHGNFGHGNTLFEEVTHIPLILRYPPGVPAGAQDDALVSLVDIAPTILDYCQLPVPPNTWGSSLQAVMNGEVAPRLLPLERSFVIPDGNRIKLDEMRGVRAEDFKLIRDTDGAGGKTYFYDLENDPKELTPQLTGQVGKGDPRIMQARLFWQGLDRAAKQFKAQLGELPEDLEGRLDDFGYMGDDEPEDAPKDE
jgi:arylsulfatase A-like enzyme